MKKCYLVVGGLVAALAACSSSTTQDPPPSSCDPTTGREGTYRVHYVYVSGNCGDIPDEDVVFVDPTAPSGDGGAPTCTVNSQSLSTNGCKINRDLTCPLDGGGSIRTVGSTSQDNVSGSLVSGSATFYISGSSSNCTGTYDLSASRL